MCWTLQLWSHLQDGGTLQSEDIKSHPVDYARGIFLSIMLKDSRFEVALRYWNIP